MGFGLNILSAYQDCNISLASHEKELVSQAFEGLSRRMKLVISSVDDTQSVLSFYRSHIHLIDFSAKDLDNHVYHSLSSKLRRMASKGVFVETTPVDKGVMRFTFPGDVQNKVSAHILSLYE